MLSRKKMGGIISEPLIGLSARMTESLGRAGNRRPSRHYMSGCSTLTTGRQASELPYILQGIFCFCTFLISALLLKHQDCYHKCERILFPREYLFWYTFLFLNCARKFCAQGYWYGLCNIYQGSRYKEYKDNISSPSLSSDLNRRPAHYE